MDAAVSEAMRPYFSRYYANPSSTHKGGIAAREALERARNKIAAFLGTEGADIIFTSGALESDNLAIQGFALANKQKGDHIITFSKEAPPVLGPCRFLEKSGFEVSYLNSPGELSPAIRKDTILVATSVPVAKKIKPALFLDASGIFGKIALDVNKLSVDLLSCDSADIGGPAGVGALYIRKGIKIKPLFSGGRHERNLRAGTENVAGAVGFAKAVELAAKCL